MKLKILRTVFQISNFLTCTVIGESFVEIPPGFPPKKSGKLQSLTFLPSSPPAEMSLKVLDPSQKSLSQVAPKCNLGSKETAALKERYRVVK